MRGVQGWVVLVVLGEVRGLGGMTSRWDGFAKCRGAGAEASLAGLSGEGGGVRVFCVRRDVDKKHCGSSNRLSTRHLDCVDVR